MVTVSSVITRAQRRADMENSDFISPEAWLEIVSDSYADLYDLLTTKFEDYFVTGPTAATVSSGNTIALASDFYKLRGLDKSDGGRWREVQRTDFSERNAGEEGTVTGSYRYWYVPAPQPFAADTDEFAVYGWERWIVADAARKAHITEESDTTAIERELAQIEKRIEVAAQNRDVSQSAQIVDVTRSDGRRVGDVRYVVLGSNIMLIPWSDPYGYNRRVF